MATIHPPRLRPDPLRRFTRIPATALLSALMLTVLLGLPPGARAESRLYLELPVTFTFTGDIQGDSASVSGYQVGYGFGGGWGLGYEDYTVTVEDVVSNLGTEVDYSFVDAFLFFDLFGLSWQLGGGMGSATVLPFKDGLGNEFTVDKADATQFLLTAAYPIAASSALAVGYRAIRADAGSLLINGADTGSGYDLSGRALSVGLQLVF